MHDGWADWDILEPLSSGSSGIVYRACRKGFPDYLSAIKVVEVPSDREQIADMQKAGMSDEQIRNMLKERMKYVMEGIRRMERFRGQSHLVSIEDFRMENAEDGMGGRALIRMEYLKPLPAYIADKKLSVEEVIRMGIDLCSALEILHGSGVVHQDIKPDNIFVNDRLPGGVIYKLGDLDMLRDLSEHMPGEEIRGTPSFLAPETLDGTNVDARADLYALGLTMYYLINDNRLPFLPKRQFSSHHDLEIATQMRLTGTELPDPEGAEESLCQVLKKACAFRPEDRYRSAAEMRENLEDLLSSRRGEEKAAGRDVSEDEAETEQWAKKKSVLMRIGWVAAASILILCGILVHESMKKQMTTEKTSEAAYETPSAIAVQGETLLEEKLSAFFLQVEEKSILPSDGKCRIPLNVTNLPALSELDTFLAQTYGAWPPAAPLFSAELYGTWKNASGLSTLETDYSPETGELKSWGLSMLLQDRANGWSMTRYFTGDAGWRLRWSPPLRVSVAAEYGTDGNLIRIIRGKQKYEVQDGLPVFQEVEYLQ